MPMSRKNQRLLGPNPDQSVRGQSFALALLLHALVLAAFAYAGFRGMVPTHEPEFSAMVRASLSAERFETAPPESGEAHWVDEPAPEADGGVIASDSAALVVEPGEAVVSGLARDVLAAAHKPPPPDALAELARKAEVLQRVSNPEEVRRIAQQVRRVLGAPPPIAQGVPAPGGQFDYDNPLVVDAIRIERPGEVEIRETLADPAGRSITICTVRREDAMSGAFQYERILIEPQSQPHRTPSDRETFEEALARQQPFEVINQFPLLRQIHDEAVLPILGKLSREEGSAAKPANAAVE